MDRGMFASVARVWISGFHHSMPGMGNRLVDADGLSGGGTTGQAGPHVKHSTMGGLGTGWTPHTAAVQGGSGGVGIRNSFPWVDAEPPGINVPDTAPLLGKGPTNPAGGG